MIYGDGPKNVADITSALDAAQVKFETMVVDGNLSPRAQTRERLDAAIAAYRSYEAKAHRQQTRKVKL